MRLFTALVLVVSLRPGIAAQTTTADGVQAFLRGDYETAAGILKPLAEDTPQPDPIAQFFLASLYESGRGTVRSEFRACGLYLSAGSVTNPLMRQAFDLAQSIRLPQIGPASDAMCAPANTHPWSEAQPASFTLGPGHWVRLDAVSTTIGFGGTEHRTVASRSGPGLVYLPMQYTAVDVTQPIAIRRHFIHLFVWHRNAPSDLSTWSLGWLLEEIVGGEISMAAGDGRLVSITALQPPSAIDPLRLVDVRVNATGEAEWVIDDLAGARGAVIPMKGGR